MRTLSGLIVLMLLAGAVYYFWRYRPAEVQSARQAVASIGDKLQATKTAAAVKASLELDRDLKEYPIDVDAGEQPGVVILRGEVPREELRAAAEARASAVPDVRQVANELRVNPGLPTAAEPGRTLGENFDDRALEAKVKMAFSLNRELKGSDIEVRSYRRTVTLAGRADTSAQRQLAVDIARRTTDVIGVTDQIGVGGGPPAASPPPAPASPPAASPAGAPTPRTGGLDPAGIDQNVATP